MSTKLASAANVIAAIESLISNGIHMDNITVELIRGRLGGGSRGDIHPVLARYRQEAQKKAVLSQVAEALPEDILADIGQQVVGLVRALHVSKLAEINHELTLSRSDAAAVLLENEQIHSANMELNAERNDLKAELAQLRAEYGKASSSIAALTALNRQMQERNAVLEKQNSMSLELAELRKLVEQKQAKPQPEPAETVAGSTVRQISTAAKSKAARNASKSSKTTASVI